MRKYKYSEKEILAWAEYYLEGHSLMEVEKVAGVPDATIWWSFVHRLPDIDYSLSERIMQRLLENNLLQRKEAK